jgi:hypothetical protein
MELEGRFYPAKERGKIKKFKENIKGKKLEELKELLEDRTLRMVEKGLIREEIEKKSNQ